MCKNVIQHNAAKKKKKCSDCGEEIRMEVDHGHTHTHTHTTGILSIALNHCDHFTIL